MKRLFLIVIFSVIYYSSSKLTYTNPSKADAFPEACSSKELINETKELLKPDFLYDGYKLIKVRLKETPQVKRIDMPLYQEVDYKFVFNRTALPKGSEIRVYHGRIASAAHLQFNSNDFDAGENLLVYVPAKDLNLLYIEFKIPAASEGVTSGCICTVAGYRLRTAWATPE